MPSDPPLSPSFTRSVVGLFAGLFAGPGPRRKRAIWPLVALVVACVLPEVVLQLNDWGLIGPQYLRALAYLLGSFQPGFLDSGWSVFPGQTVTMFITYAFLHTGLIHLIGNVAVLWWLGQIVLRKRHAGEFLALYTLSVIGAGVAFAVIGPAQATMVGASGALFGFLGALSAENRVGRLRHLPTLLRVFVVAVVLVAFDFASRLILGSQVAWQAHLGGFLSGAAFALIRPIRRR